jgi:hypothetical protein
MKKILYFAFLLIGLTSYAQVNLCTVSILPQDTTVCPNSPVQVVVLANLINSNQSFNFNTSGIPAGWGAAGGTAFTAPCGANPTGTPYYWASTAGSGIPQITTAQFDVSCGGIVNFDMVFSVQGGPSPCEGPDQLDEGIAFQYSTDGGLTWNTILYYAPDGNSYPIIQTSTASVAFGPTTYTTWGTFSVPIPPAALTSSTAFRWFQPNSSGSCCDNWGLDNIFINATGSPCGSTAVLDWSNGIGNEDTSTIICLADTTFTVSVYDTAGNFQCQSAPYTINVFDDNMSYALADTVYSYCPTTNPPVSITGISGGVPPYAYDWSTGSTTIGTVLPTGGAEQAIIDFTVEITDQCGFVRLDDVTLVVNQLLSIDSVLSIPTSICENNGVVQAFVSGFTAVPAPLYNWSGPSTTPINFNGTVWIDRPAGWYYFTVTDAVCTENDSVFVDILDPPIASFEASVESGCIPFDVTFTNTSENATNYSWDFDNGNTLNTGSQDPLTTSYINDGQIELIAFDANGCSDTSYVQVYSSICGCNDPLAVNYDPLVEVNNGACIFPDPVITLPNVFTPNGLEQNNNFEIISTYASLIEMRVENRWGQIVFEGSGPTSPKWDGTSLNGTDCIEGTYFVFWKVVNVNGTKTLEGHGFVELIR